MNQVRGYITNGVVCFALALLLLALVKATGIAIIRMDWTAIGALALIALAAK